MHAKRVVEDLRSCCTWRIGWVC